MQLYLIQHLIPPYPTTHHLSMTPSQSSSASKKKEKATVSVSLVEDITDLVAEPDRLPGERSTAKDFDMDSWRSWLDRYLTVIKVMPHSPFLPLSLTSTLYSLPAPCPLLTSLPGFRSTADQEQEQVMTRCKHSKKSSTSSYCACTHLYWCSYPSLIQCPSQLQSLLSLLLTILITTPTILILIPIPVGMTVIA